MASGHWRGFHWYRIELLARPAFGVGTLLPGRTLAVGSQLARNVPEWWVGAAFVLKVLLECGDREPLELLAWWGCRCRDGPKKLYLRRRRPG